MNAKFIRKPASGGAGSSGDEEDRVLVHVSSSYGFITETFYLTGRIIGLAFSSMTESYKETLRMLKQVLNALERAESMQGPAQSVMGLTQQRDLLYRHKLCIEVYLLKNELSLPALIRYAATSASWLMALYADKPITLPLPVSFDSPTP